MRSTTNQGGRGGAGKTEKKVSVGCDELKRFVITLAKCFLNSKTFGAHSLHQAGMTK